MLWHYTIYKHAEKICADGQIKLASAGIIDFQKNAVWFSTDQRWEPTANKAILTPNGIVSGDLISTFRLGGGLVRFRVARSTAPVSWRVFRRTSGITQDEARRLEKAGRDVGADPIHWFCSFDPVHRNQWLGIDEIRTVEDLAAFDWRASERLA